MPAGEVRAAVKAAVGDGRMGDRLWLYATYHCNLRCSYCLTESGPRIADRRELDGEAMVTAARAAAPLGFTRVGVTGGEVFMLPGIAGVLRRLAAELPTTVLTNGTLLGDRVLHDLAPLAGDERFALQVSLDSADPVQNDAMRGPRNFARVCAALPRLRERGIRVRIATTVDDQSPDELARLCDLHRSFGIPDEDHIVRPVVRRGRAATRGIGVVPAAGDILPELTLTAEGAFTDPFGPTVRRGVTDLDRLVRRETRPMIAAVEAFLAAIADRPGADAQRSIR
ncbi:MAG TPA: radical SAM protein [Gaiellales bacterium]|jgi:MoaA/NifB/PqqE/SkfB family radical SAM enzyme